VATLLEQIAEIEAGVTRLHQRVPDLPVTEILTSRLLVYLGREMLTRFDLALRPHGLNEVEFRALIAVYSANASTANPSDLCTGLGQSPANVTRITDVLVERDLLLRLPDTEDRRRLLLQVTPQGDALIREILPVLIKVASDTYRDFSAEELQEFQANLRKLAATVDRVITRKSSADAHNSGASS